MPNQQLPIILYLELSSITVKELKNVAKSAYRT